MLIRVSMMQDVTHEADSTTQCACIDSHEPSSFALAKPASTKGKHKGRMGHIFVRAQRPCPAAYAPQMQTQKGERRLLPCAEWPQNGCHHAPL